MTAPIIETPAGQGTEPDTEETRRDGDAAALRGDRRWLLALVLVCIGIYGVAAVLSDPDDHEQFGGAWKGGQEPVAEHADAPTASADPQEIGPAAQSFTDIAVCGSFRTVDRMVASARRDRVDAGPVGLPRTRPGPDFIGYADALNNSREGVSPGLQSALSTYVHSLVVFGAAVNEDWPEVAVTDIDGLVDSAAYTVEQLCAPTG